MSVKNVDIIGMNLSWKNQKPIQFVRNAVRKIFLKKYQIFRSVLVLTATLVRKVVQVVLKIQINFNLGYSEA
jgi:hypothetical protein